MTITIKILLFCGAIIGGVLLGFCIRNLTRLLTKPPILELPFLDKSGEFTLTKPGRYRIWQAGRRFRKTLLSDVKLRVTNTATQEEVSLSPVLVPMQVNGMSKARNDVFSFRANEGVYRLELTPGRSVSAVSYAILSLLPFKKMAPEDFSLQVRESDIGATILYILAIIFSAQLMIGGVLVALLADQIFS